MAKDRPLRKITVEVIFEPMRSKTLLETERHIRNELGSKSYILNAAILSSEPRGAAPCEECGATVKERLGGSGCNACRPRDGG